MIFFVAEVAPRPGRGEARRQSAILQTGGLTFARADYESKKLTPVKTNKCPIKKDYFNRKYIFQPLFLRDMLVFRGVPSGN